MIASGAALPTIAQPVAKSYKTDDLLPRWVIDVNLLGGLADQSFKTTASMPDYPNALNANTGKLEYKNGYSFGGDAQVGFFFGAKRHFGLGTGVLLMQQHGDAILDNYHVEYKATDGVGNIYRQLVTGNDVREEIVSKNINIPFVLKYKNRFSRHWGFTADAGALINLQMKNAYTTHASFNYEAIYKLTQSSDGGTVSVYDDAVTPSSNDWFITKGEFLQNNPNGNYQAYIDAKRALGYNVGEGLNPGTRTGKTSYTRGSIGFMVQPSVNYFLSDNVALNFGLYYMFQPFKDNTQSNYRLTDGMGTYSSNLNSVKSSHNQQYGINLGVRFFLGKTRTPLTIASIDKFAPTQCGMCDGGMALNGLPANKQVTVVYTLNGAQPSEYATTVPEDGKVKISNLCSGNYTGITARIKRQSADGQPVTITDPPMSISSQTVVNPTLSESNDGSVTFNGMYAGKTVTIDYSKNGGATATYTGIINEQNAVTVSGLSEGKYTSVVATINKCSAIIPDFTLKAPAPPAVVETVVEKTYTGEKIDNADPVLFDFDRSIVRKEFYPELKLVAAEMKENKDVTVTINGYTDSKGSVKYNNALSVRRANAVKSKLTKMGVNPRNLKAVGHGETSPAADNNTAAGRRENRRATMKVNNGK